MASPTTQSKGGGADISSLLALADIATMTENERPASQTNTPCGALPESSSLPSLPSMPSMPAGASALASADNNANNHLPYFSRAGLEKKRANSSEYHDSSRYENAHMGHAAASSTLPYGGGSMSQLLQLRERLGMGVPGHHTYDGHEQTMLGNERVAHANSSNRFGPSNNFAERMERGDPSQYDMLRPTAHYQPKSCRPAKKRAVPSPAEPSFDPAHMSYNFSRSLGPNSFGLAYADPEVKQHAVAAATAMASSFNLAEAKRSKYNKKAKIGKTKKETKGHKNGKNKSCKSQQNEASFPVNLMAIMTAPQNESIIAFLSDDKSFIIINPMSLQNDVLPVYFQDGYGKPKLKSVEEFEDLLELWGFEKVTDPNYPQVNVWRHAMFKKGDWEACLAMKLPLTHSALHGGDYANSLSYAAQSMPAPKAPPQLPPHQHQRPSWAAESQERHAMAPPSNMEQRPSTPVAPEAPCNSKARSVTPSESLSPSAARGARHKQKIDLGSVGLTASERMEQLRMFESAQLEAALMERMASETESRRLSELMGMSNSQLEQFLDRSSTMDDSMAYNLLMKQRMEREMQEQSFARGLQHQRQQGFEHGGVSSQASASDYNSRGSFQKRRSSIMSEKQETEDMATVSHPPERMNFPSSLERNVPALQMPRANPPRYSDAEVECATANVVTAALDALRRDRLHEVQMQAQQQAQFRQRQLEEMRQQQMYQQQKHSSASEGQSLDAMTEQFLSRSMARLHCLPGGVPASKSIPESLSLNSLRQTYGE